jgi:AraC family transcriptional regulator
MSKPAQDPALLYLYNSRHNEKGANKMSDSNMNTETMTIETQAQWPGVNLYQWRGRPGYIPEHRYQAHQLNISLAGRMTTMRQTATGRQWTNCSDNPLCLVPVGQCVGAEIHEETTAVSLMLNPVYVQETGLANDWPGGGELIEKAGFEDPLLQQIGLALYREAQSSAPQGNLYAESLNQMLAMHLLRHYSVSRSQPSLFNGGLPAYKLRRVQEFIRANLAETVALEQLANVAGLSAFHFARAFKRATGETPQRYLTQTRIEQAKRLLTNDNMSLVDVGAQVGFKNQSHFTAVFHRFVGATPKHWRNTHSVA